MKSKPLTRAEKARIEAGLTKAQAAERARVCVSYLRRIELHGRAPYVLATRLAHIYGCPIDIFL